MKLRHLPALLGITLIASPLFAQTIVYDEFVDGDLSGTGLAPTAISLVLGLNTIQGDIGTTGALPSIGSGTFADNGGSRDTDFFTFVLSPGQSVTAITTTREGVGIQSFFGQADGSTIPSISSAGLDSGVLFGNGPLSLSNEAPGLSAIPIPLNSGPQTFIVQETGEGVYSYSVTFNVAAAVPEPSSVTLLSGLAACGFLRRRRN